MGRSRDLVSTLNERLVTRLKHLPIDPSTLPSYDYQPLGHNEFRLLVLLQGSENESLHVEIEHANVLNAHEFAALSYVWGERRDDNNYVVIGEKSKLKITYSLWQALRRIRAKDEDRVLFVDAICINQKDNIEKAQQIQYMSRIYPQASRVLCWLGDDDGSAAEAFAFLRQWRLARSNEALRVELTRDARERQKTMLSATGAPGPYAAVDALFSRSYFRRAWCLQEVFVAATKPPLLLCSQHEACWTDLYFGFYTMTISLLDQDDKHLIFGRGVEYLIPMMTIYSTPPSRMSFSYIWPTVPDREATKPQDKIFSILALVKSSGSKYPAPNYDWTIEQVCTIYTRAIVEVDESLNILSALNGFQEDDKVPSWSIKPDRWRKNDSDGVLEEHTSQTDEEWATKWYAACRLKPCLEPSIGLMDPVLGVFGIKFDRISRLVDTLPVWVRNLTKDSTTWDKMLQECHDFCVNCQLPSEYVATGESMTEALLRTLTGDAFWIHSKSERWSHWRDRSFAAYQAHMRGEASEGDATLGAPQQTMGKDELFRYMAENFRFKSPSSSSRISIGDTSSCIPTSFLNRRAIWELGATLQYNVHSRKLLVTAKGYIGIAPFASQEGDRVCIMPGSTVPLILREKQRGGGGRDYHFIGDAYVHGVMYGEAVNHLPDVWSAQVPSSAGLTLFRIV